MSRTIKLYAITLEKEGEIIKFDWLKFFNELGTLDNSYRRIDGYPTKVKNLEDYNNHTLFLSVFKFRGDHLPYIEDKKTGDAIPISNPVIEITTLFFDNNSNTIAIEYNPEGSKEKNIISYLQTFFTEEYLIKFKEIRNTTTEEEIFNSERIKYFEVTFNLDYFNQNELENAMIPNAFTPVMNSIFGIKEAIESNKFTIKFDTNKRSHSLNTVTLKEFIRGFDIESGLIDSIKIYFKKNGNMTPIDITKLGKPLTFRILENSSDKGWENIRRAVFDEYMREYSDVCYNQNFEFLNNRNDINQEIIFLGTPPDEFIETKVTEILLDESNIG